MKSKKLEHNDKFVFIDRDGVINKDPGGWTKYGYVTRVEDLHFLPGVLEAIRKLTKAGYRIIVISNQQGIGKKYFTLADLDKVNRDMLRTIEKAGGKIDAVFYCPHLKEKKCGCRKPESGMFLKARDKFGIKTFGDRFFIGDTQRDIKAGKKVGLKTILVLSGKASKDDVKTWESRPDHICKGLYEAVKLVINADKGRKAG